MGWNLKKKFKSSKIHEWSKFSHDPGGLFVQSNDATFAKWQKTLDIGGYGAKPAQAAQEAEAAGKKQEAAIAKQEAEIEKKRKQQQNVIEERAGRMAKNQLLSGKETGVTGSYSLLGR